MKSKLLRKLAKSQKYLILAEIKRSQGLSVSQLCERINLSYMGVKQHCVALEKDGYLDTWRRPQKMGRPEMVYRLTRRSHDLFPTDSNEFTLELLKSIRDIYGANAPEKLLYNVFEKRSAALKAKVKGENVVERAKWLAKVRDGEGYMSQFLPSEKEGPQILECHSPIFNLIEKYPIIGRLEQDLFEAVLGTSVRREETRTSGLYECAFYFAA